LERKSEQNEFSSESKIANLTLTLTSKDYDKHPQFVHTLFSTGSFSFAHLQLIKHATHSSQLFKQAYRHTSRLTISSRSSNLLSTFFLAPQIRLLLTIVRVYRLRLLTSLGGAVVQR